MAPPLKRIKAYEEHKLDSGGLDYKAGCLKRLKLTNFMVHQKLDLKLGSRVNIITGTNGSGKSSVLQAIILALGGNVKDLRRGIGNLSSFVRVGCSKAVIELTIENGGEYGFKPEIYGSEIIFERTIANTDYKGSSQSVVKSSLAGGQKLQGRQATSERDSICKYFFIDLTNPLIILPQEEAKAFFSANNKQKMLEFFNKGTMLKHSQELLSSSDVETGRTTAAVKLKNKKLEDAKQTQKGCGKRLENIQKNDVSGRLRELEKSHRLSKAQSLKQEVDEISLQLEEAKVHLSELELLEKSTDEEIFRLEQVKLATDSQIADLNSDIGSQNEKLAAIKNDLDNLADKKSHLDKIVEDGQMEIRKFEDEIKRKRNELRVLNTKKDDVAENIKSRIESLIRKIENKSQEITDHGRERKRFQDEMEVTVKQKDAKLADETRLKKEWENCTKLRKEKAQTNYHRFGLKMSHLVSDLPKSQRLFTRPPIGPLGEHIKLKSGSARDPRYAKILETFIGRNLLEAFIVHDKKDIRPLKDLMFANGLKMNKIYVQPFDKSRFNISARKVRSTFPSALDFLHIDKNPVFNLLTTLRRAETVLVTECEDAQKLFSSPKSVPENAAKIISPDFFEYFPPKNGGNYSSYYINRSKQISGNILTPYDEANQAKQLLEREDEIKDAISRVGNEIQHLHRRICEIDENLKKVSELNKQLQASLDKMRQELNKSKQEEVTFKEAGQILSNCIESLTSQVATRREQLREEKHEKRKVGDELEAVSDQHHHLQAIVLQKMAVLEEISDKETKLHKLVSDKNAIEKKKTSLKNRIKKFSSEQEVKTELFEQAKRILDPDVDLDSIPFIPLAKILADRAALEIEQKKRGTSDGQTYYNLLKRKNDATIRITMLEKEIPKLESTIKQQIETLQARKNDFLVQKNSILRTLKRSFKENLNDNGLNGYFVISQADQTLSIEAGKLSNENKTGPIQSLSGGERTKVVISMIVSLWQLICCPFRCLDEWDVFLDAVARQKAEELMITVAKKSNKQYLLISPQGTNCFNNNDDSMKIIILESRQRND